jgi:hypothetical protein
LKKAEATKCSVTAHIAKIVARILRRRIERKIEDAL